MIRFGSCQQREWYEKNLLKYYISGSLGPVGDTGNVGPQGPRGPKGEKGKGLSGVKYVRWGKTNCSGDASLVYSGKVHDYLIY